MAMADVPDLALLDNESRRDAYLTHAKVRDLDAHPSFRPMVAELVARYKADKPELFQDEA
jgi:aromatic ring hydroxylase